MGLSRWIFVESKSFEFALDEGVHVLRVSERSKGFMHSVSLGKVIVLWLVDFMEELLNVEVTKEFLKSTRVGSKAFIVQ